MLGGWIALSLINIDCLVLLYLSNTKKKTNTYK